ncbi:MAG: oligosaccharide repeat unit polymerase [Chloroflexaceae bacterium]|nr:oligosaccharide repeat unit polymerase [Chloroflexaceae bacterium]
MMVERRVSKLFLLLPALAAGLLLSLLFLFDVVFPVEVSVLLLLLVTTWGLVWFRTGHISLLLRLSIVIYVLPFNKTLEYLWGGTPVLYPTPLATMLSTDRPLVSQMLMLALVGLLGLLVGFGLVIFFRRDAHFATEPDFSQPLPTLDHVSFWVALLAAVAFSWMSAQPETILTTPYMQGPDSFATTLNFNSAYTVSYALLFLLFIDAEREHTNLWRRQWKLLAILGATIFITVFLQFLRGDREVISLLVGLMALYITSPAVRRPMYQSMTQPPQSNTMVSRSKREWRRVARLIAPIVVIAIVASILGSVRRTLSQSDAPLDVVDALVENLEYGTWNAISLTNLGIAMKYRYDDIDYLYGQTFVEYAMSLPPGFITSALGIERPLEGNRGPAWWFVGIGSGGIHIALVPFRNFGIFGVFVIVMIYGWCIAQCELASYRAAVWQRMLYAAMVSTLPLWFWYGDMYIIRVLMVAALAVLAYHLALRLGEQVLPGRFPSPVR